MENLKKIIRKVLFEAFRTDHFKKREFDRLNSENSNFHLESEKIKKEVNDSIVFLSKVNFPGQDNIGVLLLKGGKKYTYENPNSEKGYEKSEGSNIWAVIRGNDLETIYFMAPGTVPQNTQLQIKISDLKNFIEKIKNGSLDLTDKDIARLKRGDFGTREIKPQKEEVPFVNVKGVKWVIDKPNERIYQKNKPENIVSVYDLESVFGKEEADRILHMFL